MKYICTIEIDRPLLEVVALWNDERYFSKWQNGYKSTELLEGSAGKVGSKSRILIQQGKHKIELIETILINDLPTEKKGLYEHTHMTNTQSSRFEAISDNRTLYTSEVEYTVFKSFMLKFTSRLFSKTFKNHSKKWMDHFKIFAENHK